jgi:hypothetical protein
VLANVLCLCPNDHVWFDYGAIWLDEHLQVVDAELGKVGHRIYPPLAPELLAQPPVIEPVDVIAAKLPG